MSVTMSEYRAFVREYSAAPYVFPGGGEVYLLLSDGECLCARCAYKARRESIRQQQAAWDSERRAYRAAWRISGNDGP